MASLEQRGSIMTRLLPLGAKVLGGFFVAALFAFPQAYTISAKPGAVNYIEGNAQLDGRPLTISNLKAVFMNAGSLLETRDGKVEVLLTPGVFLRVGENSRVRMLKPSLVDTEIAIEAGESMLEVDQFVKDSHITVSVHGGLTEIAKNGLYRFRADGQASVAVIDGKAEVSFGEKHASLGKGREALLTDALKVQEFDKNEPDELYAWSNIRAEYNASVTYQAARSANSSSGYAGGGYGGYGVASITAATAAVFMGTVGIGVTVLIPGSGCRAGNSSVRSGGVFMALVLFRMHRWCMCPW